MQSDLIFRAEVLPKSSPDYFLSLEEQNNAEDEAVGSGSNDAEVIIINDRQNAIEEGWDSLILGEEALDELYADGAGEERPLVLGFDV